MKKLFLLVALTFGMMINAQNTQVTTKKLQLESVPVGTKNDSLLVRGSDKIVKTIPLSTAIQGLATTEETNAALNEIKNNISSSFILSNNGYNVSGLNVTVNANWEWQLKGVYYTNSEPFIYTTPLCSAGKQRFDIVVLTDIGMQLHMGTESVSNPAIPVYPFDNLMAITFLVTDSNVTTTPTPNYELTSNKQNSLAVDGTGTKYPTVDAVNSIKGNYITIASSTASDTAKQTANFVCDGTADDVQINAAIQSLPAWGGRIQLTNGLFYINSPIIVDRAVTLVGEGTGIAGRNVGNMYGAQEGITTIRASADVDVIMVNSAFKIKGIKFADFILQGFGKDISSKIGIYIKTETDVMQIQGVNVLDCGIGIYGKKLDAPTIISSSFQYNALGGLMIRSAYINIVSCVFADNNGVSTATVDGVTHTVDTGGLAIGGFNSMITASTFVRNDKSGTPYNSISILDATSMRINNCAVNEQNGNAIGIIGTATGYAEDTQISNCTITRFGTTLTANKRNGIYILKGHVNHIYGNYIGSGLGYTNSEYAVYEDRVVNTYTGITLVKNNVFRDIQNAAKVYLTGSQSNYTKNINVGGLDTDNQAFLGIKSTKNTGASLINGIVLTQSGTNTDGVYQVINTTTGTAEMAYNNSTGILRRTNNTTSGTGDYMVNLSNGVGRLGRNDSSGTLNSAENQSTGILNLFNSTTASTGDLVQFRKNGIITTKIGHNGKITTPAATESTEVVVKSQLDLKANLASPALTGTPTAPTAAPGTNTTQIATMEALQAAKQDLQSVLDKGFVANKGIALQDMPFQAVSTLSSVYGIYGAGGITLKGSDDFINNIQGSFIRSSIGSKSTLFSMFRVADGGIEYNLDPNKTAGNYTLATLEDFSKRYTVSSLPTPTESEPVFAIVTDALAPTYMATVVGGGAVVCPVFYNGTNWVAH